MNCSCHCQPSEIISKQIQKFESDVHEMRDAARRLLQAAKDPVSAVIGFLQERPEGALLLGSHVRQLLLDTFGSTEQVPSLVRLLSGHVREIVRQANVINVHNEHLCQEVFAGYIVKLKEQIKFEVVREKDKIALRNINGLVCIEHGLEVPLDKILINPPRLEITLRLGPLRPVKAVDIA